MKRQNCGRYQLDIRSRDSPSGTRIKGRQFNLLNLLGSETLASQFEGGSLAAFRLAPQDYHRFHSPADVTIGQTYKFPGYVAV